jgi:hypothetical protein
VVLGRELKVSWLDTNSRQTEELQCTSR